MFNTKRDYIILVYFSFSTAIYSKYLFIVYIFKKILLKKMLKYINIDVEDVYVVSLSPWKPQSHRVLKVNELNLLYTECNVETVRDHWFFHL